MTEDKSNIEEKILVTVEKITHITKHPNADVLYIARVQGYDVIINLAAMFGSVTPESLIGQLVVYFQIDSIMPAVFEKCSFWNYLDSTYMGKRIKSAKIRGIISQGLILTFNDILPVFPKLFESIRSINQNSEDANNTKDTSSFPEGFNLTNALCVTKYYHRYDAEGPAYSGEYDRSKIKTRTSPASLLPFPEYIPKTDQPRLQSNINIIRNLPDDRLFTATLKFDGQSTTWVYNNGESFVCSRNYTINLELDKDPSKRDKANDKFRYINEKYNLLDKLKSCDTNIAIQAEMYGMSINGNRHHKNDIDIAVFDIYDIDKRRYLSHSDTQAIATLFNLPTVTTVFEKQTLLSKDIEPWIQLANNCRYHHPHKNLLAEGIVVKSDNDIAPYMSFKVISPEYLIKHNI